MSFLIRLLVNALALYLLTRVYSGVSFAPGADVFSILTAALVMGIVNALIRPLLLLISLPINILTLGLFTFVINGLVLWIVGATTALDVASFGAALIGALILTIISWLLDTILAAVGLDVQDH